MRCPMGFTLTTTLLITKKKKKHFTGMVVGLFTVILQQPLHSQLGYKSVKQKTAISKCLMFEQ